MRELGCQIKFRGKTRVGNESGHEIELWLHPQDRRTEKKFGTNLDLTWILEEKKIIVSDISSPRVKFREDGKTYTWLLGT